jgi:hypothetical protein
VKAPRRWCDRKWVTEVPRWDLLAGSLSAASETPLKEKLVKFIEKLMPAGTWNLDEEMGRIYHDRKLSKLDQGRLLGYTEGLLEFAY